MKNNTAQATKVITAHVPLPMADKVDQMAARLERSRGWIIKQALSAWLAQEEERNRLTLEAIYHCTLSLTERKTLTTFPSNSWTANAKLVCSSLEYVTFS